MKDKKISIVIADDHPIFRRGLADLLARESEFNLVGEVQNGARTLELVEQISPDVVVLDIDMPVLDGVAVAKIIREKRLPTKTVFLTMHRNQSVVRSMNKLGVSGYVLKDAVMDEIVECIQSICRGEIFLSSGLTTQTGGTGRDKTKPLPIDELQKLSDTELKVLAEIARSKTNRDIADDLFISVRTVETHRYNICQKLGIRGPHALVKFAMANKSAIRPDSEIRISTDEIE